MPFHAMIKTKTLDDEIIELICAFMPFFWHIGCSLVVKWRKIFLIKFTFLGTVFVIWHYFVAGCSSCNGGGDQTYETHSLWPVINCWRWEHIWWEMIHQHSLCLVIGIVHVHVYGTGHLIVWCWWELLANDRLEQSSSREDELINYCSNLAVTNFLLEQKCIEESLSIHFICITNSPFWFIHQGFNHPCFFVWYKLGEWQHFSIFIWYKGWPLNCHVIANFTKPYRLTSCFQSQIYEEVKNLVVCSSMSPSRAQVIEFGRQLAGVDWKDIKNVCMDWDRHSATVFITQLM